MNWAELLKHFTLRPSFPLRLEVREEPYGRHSIVALFDAPDIHTGQPQAVHHAWPAPDLADAQPQYALDVAIDFVRSLLIDCLRHELDECLLFDGVQLRDPHTTERPSP